MAQANVFGGNVDIRAKRILAVSAGLLVLCGCAPATQQAPDAVVDELNVILRAAVEDRNASILADPPAKRLDDGDMTAAFKEARTREASELAARSQRFKANGFWYVGSSSSLTVQSAALSGDRHEAVVTFNELTELRVASAAGPSDVPEKYSLDQTARFVATENGWQLSELGLGDNSAKGLLPSTIVASQG